jgi:hypothetical protein
MHAVNIVLYLGAFFLALFSFLFLAGSLGQLLGLIAEGIRALSGRRGVEANVPQSKPAARPAMPTAVHRDLPWRGARLAPAGWLKTCAVVLSALAVGIVAITVAEETASSLHGFAAPAVQGAATTAPAPLAGPAGPLSAEDRLPPGASETGSLPAAAPRECSPKEGVVTDCTYN